MTGDNNRQKFLKNVAFGLDATKSNSLSWIAPEVEPHAPIYFFMFTNGNLVFRGEGLVFVINSYDI